MRNTILVEAREKAGFTQAQIAEKTRISENSYQRYELGLREPRAKIANRIAKVLHTTTEKLFGT